MSNAQALPCMLGDLFTAIGQGNVDLVKKLVGEGADINSSGVNVPPLVYAVQLEPDHLLIMDQEGRLDTPYHSCLIDGDPMTDSGIDTHPVSDIVKFLLSLDGTDVNIHGTDSRSPLHTAVENSLAGTVRELLKKGADVNVKDKMSGRTPLHYAARQGCAALITLLLNHGASVDAVDDTGRTPLYMAVTNSEVPFSIIQLLLQSGSSVNVLDYNTGRSLLHEAVYDVSDINTTIQIINLLMSAGALFVTDGFGMNPVHESFKWNAFSCLTEFVRHGAEIETLLSEFGEATLCEILLTKIANLYSAGVDCVKLGELKMLFHVIEGDGYSLKGDSFVKNLKFDTFSSSAQDCSKLVKFVIELKNRFPTLQNLCRHQIRSCLKACANQQQSIIPLIDSLEIPHNVKEYLSLSTKCCTEESL